jgi:adenylate cyclase
MWQYRQALNIISASTFVGMSYAIFGDGFSSLVPFINGSIIGFLGGIGLSAGELLLFKSIRQRITFPGIVILKSVCYTLMMIGMIFTEILISRSLQNRDTLSSTFHSLPFQHFLLHEDFIIIICYAMTFISLLIFTKEMSRKMGQGVLLNFITGRYFKPKQEKRIFMFLDMKSSVSKAERLGDLEYHNLLRDFFRDITECILSAHGKIHHYVGDEVVVSWPFKVNTRTERCLEAYYRSLNKIQSLQ